MAVQGAAARMITPAMYSLARSGPMRGANTCRKNTHPSNAMEKGFTSQFTTSVISRPFGRRPTPRMDAKSIRSIIG